MKIIVSEFVSLDGVMEGPGSADPFERKGWTMPYGSEQFMKFKHDELFSSDGLLLGRTTYDGFSAAWPTMTGDFADKMNELPKFVVSKTLDKLAWNNSRLINDNVVESILKLKAMPGQNILVFGSGVLLQTLMQNNLVDELRLLLFPVVVGAGKKLFKDGAQKDLELIESQSFEKGVVLLRYK